MIFLILCVFGCILGSFGSVLLIRTQDGLSGSILRGIIGGRSACPHCHHILRPWQLIPLLGWILQGGKCYDCNRSISSIYPLLELVSGLQALGIYSLYTQGMIDGGVYTVLLYLVMRLLGLLAIWDIKTMTLHMIGYYATCIASIVLIGWGIYTHSRYIVHAQLIYALVFFGFFVTIRYIGHKYAMQRYEMPEGFGRGDVLVAPIVGIVLATTFPYIDSESIILFVCIYILMTACIGLVYGIISYIYTREITIPFLPCMILGVWGMMFWWDVIVASLRA